MKANEPPQAGAFFAPGRRAGSAGRPTGRTGRPTALPGLRAALTIGFVLAWAASSPVPLIAQTETAADSTRPRYRVTFGIGDDHWGRFGFERDVRPGWAVKGMVGFGPYTGVAALGPVLRFPTGRRGELGLFAGGGKMVCSSFLDGPSPVCEQPNEDAGWGLGGGAYWLYRFGDDGEWSFGPEVAYWNRPASGDDEGFDIWTVGVVVHKRFRGR